MMNLREDEDFYGAPMPAALEPADKWILSRFNPTVREVTDNMTGYELGIAVQKVYDFIWDEFCDWYIEMVKPRLYGDNMEESRKAAMWCLTTVLAGAMKLLHPYMPFITEEIFCTLQQAEPSIMISSWPEYREDWSFAQEEREIDAIKEAVRGIRGVRNTMNVAPSKKVQITIVSEDKITLDIFTKGKLFFESLAGASDSVCQTDRTGIGEDAVSVSIPGATLYLPLAELVDIQAEIERLTKELKRLEGELARSEKMLSNEKFLSGAKPEKVAEEKEKKVKYEQTHAQVREQLARLTGTQK
jgi:valyl-tRNA synthetase